MTNNRAVRRIICQLKLYAEIIAEADRPASWTWALQQAKWGERLNGIIKDLELALDTEERRG